MKKPYFLIFSVLFQNSQKNIQEKHGRSQAERVFFFFFFLFVRPYCFSILFYASPNQSLAFLRY